MIEEFGCKNNDLTNPSSAVVALATT